MTDPDTTPVAPPAPPADPVLPRRRRWYSVLPFVALVLLAAGVVVVVAERKPGAEKADADKEKPEGEKDTVVMSKERQAVAGVETAPVTVAPLRATTWRTGRVALNEDRVAHISPPAEGIVRDVPVRLGQTVATGEVLAVIDCREFSFLKLELVKTRAALATEQDAVARVRTTTANAAELLRLLAADTPITAIETKLADKPIGDWRAQLLGAYARRDQLRTQLASLKSSGGAVPESTLLKVKSEADAAEASYTGLVEELRYQVKYQVRQAELKLRESETAVDVTKAKLMTFGLKAEDLATLDPLAEGTNASRLAVRAPFPGTVVDKHAVRSERVGPQFQMFVLSDLATVWVQADVFESDLALVRDLTGKKVTFRSELAGLSERPATVLYTGDLIDKASRTLTLTAEAPNPDRALKPGMMIEVGFESGTAAPVTQMPAVAVFRHENRPFVFVRTGPETFARRDVTLGRQIGESVEITEGLKAGETVVVRGGFVLKSELLKDQMAGE